MPVLLAVWMKIPKTLLSQIRMPLGKVLFQRNLQRALLLLTSSAHSLGTVQKSSVFTESQHES